MRKLKWSGSLISLIVFSLFMGCGNDAPKPVPVEKGEICITCRMEILDLEYAAELIKKNGEIVKFDHPICMIQYFSGGRAKEKNSILKYYVIAYDTKTWVAADSALFVRGNYRTPVMDFNVTAYSDSNTALEFKNSIGESDILSWNKMWDEYQEPDQYLRAEYKQNGLSPEVFETALNQIIQIRISNRTDKDASISIRNYPEVQMEIPYGESRMYRLKVDKPGDRFDIFENKSDKIIGRLMVTGAHLAEETKEFYEY
ncbi:MAG: nitrous oxide reductase accessory protein NosL [Calditrichaceae bacterium]